MGVSAEESIASVRVSVGLGNTVEEIDGLLAALAGEVAALRQGRVASAVRGAGSRP
jgi:selenocysteine lyase/cysteine desulfurase